MEKDTFTYYMAYYEPNLPRYVRGQNKVIALPIVGGLEQGGQI